MLGAGGTNLTQCETHTTHPVVCNQQRTEWPLLLGPRGAMTDLDATSAFTYKSGVSRKLPDTAWACIRDRSSITAPAVSADISVNVAGTGGAPPRISFRVRPLDLALTKSSMLSLGVFLEQRLPRPISSSAFAISQLTAPQLAAAPAVEPVLVETASPPLQQEVADGGPGSAVGEGAARVETSSVPEGPFLLQDGRIDSLRIIVPYNDLHLAADIAWVELAGVGANSVTNAGHSRPAWAFTGSDVKGRYSLSTFSVHALDAKITTKSKLAAWDAQEASAGKGGEEQKEQPSRSLNIHAPDVCLVLGLRDGGVPVGGGYSVARLMEAEPSPQSRLLSRSGPLVPASRLEAYFPAVNVSLVCYLLVFIRREQDSVYKLTYNNPSPNSWTSRAMTSGRFSPSSASSHWPRIAR